MGTVDIALIGCGTIGGLRAEIASQNPGVGTIHLYDVRPDAARRLAAKLPAAVAHGSAEDALVPDGLRGVVVSTSEWQHAEPTELALRRGLPTLVEKPLVHDPEIALRTAALAETSGVPLYVGYTQRFRRRYLCAKDLLASGTLGAMTGATATFFATRSIAPKILARSPRATPAAGIVTYLVDLMLWYAEPALPVRVTARSTYGSAGDAHPGVPATTWALLEFEDGRVVNVGTSWDLPANHPAYNATISMDIFGTDGFLTVDDSHRNVMVTSGSGLTAPYTPEVQVSTAFLGSHAPGDVVAGRVWGPIRAETNEFIESLASGVPSAVLSSGRHGANVVQLTSAIDDSALSRGTVELEHDRTGNLRYLAPAGAGRAR